MGFNSGFKGLMLLRSGNNIKKKLDIPVN